MIPQIMNTSCGSIKTADGFKFLYRCPEGRQVFVSHNETQIAHAMLDTQTFSYSNEVVSMDNRSVVTRDCRDLRVKCITENGNTHIKDISMYYKITEYPDPSDSPTPQNLSTVGVSVGVSVGASDGASDGISVGASVGVSLGVIVLIAIIGMLCCCCRYISWKRKQHGAPTVSGFLRYLRTCSCLRKENSQAGRGETQETRHPEGGEVQEVTAGDLETAEHNGVIMLHEISVSDPRGSGENDIEQDNTLGSVHVHSIDPQADGKTPQSFSLDRNLSNEGIQPTKNLLTSSAPDVYRASNHRVTNGSLRDDPRGVNDNSRGMQNGWTPGDRGPEDHGNEGQPLLNQGLKSPFLVVSVSGAAIQRFDMTGEAVALVNKRGFDPDPVSRCSTAPDTDVESTPSKNCTIHTY